MRICKKCGISKPFSDYSKKTETALQTFCRPCASEQQKEYRKFASAEKKEKQRLQKRNYEKGRIEFNKKRQKEFHTANPGRQIQYRLNHINNVGLEEFKRKEKIRMREWFDKNKEKSYEAGARRRVMIKAGTCSLISEQDKLQIQYFFKYASALSRIYGIKYEVDHIYPVLHKDICGLHAVENFQILTKYQNQSKSNKLPDITLDYLHDRKPKKETK